MASDPSQPVKIGMPTLAVALGLLVATEAMAWWLIPRVQLPSTGHARSDPTGSNCGTARVRHPVGGRAGSHRLGAGHLAPGGIVGACWSAGFALAAALGMAVIFFAGQNPLALLRTPMPADRFELILLFLVGGLVGPLAEEICFRGVLYTFFRRWGIWVALLFSTAIFVALHSVSGIPVTQIVGGIVFALAYETSRNLMVPITIHVLGNSAIFALSLPMFH